MFQVRVTLVFFNRNRYLRDGLTLPHFFLFKDDDIQKRILSSAKEYFKYEDLFLNFTLADIINQHGILSIVYTLLVGDDNLKGEWRDATKISGIKEQGLERIIYSAAKAIGA